MLCLVDFDNARPVSLSRPSDSLAAAEAINECVLSSIAAGATKSEEAELLYFGGWTYPNGMATPSAHALLRGIHRLRGRQFGVRYICRLVHGPHAFEASPLVGTLRSVTLRQGDKHNQKMVDTSLALDIVGRPLIAHDQITCVVSDDADLTPAIAEALRLGRRIVWLRHRSSGADCNDGHIQRLGAQIGIIGTRNPGEV